MGLKCIPHHELSIKLEYTQDSTMSWVGSDK